MKKQAKLMAASYGRCVVGAVVAVYLTGATNPTDYLQAAVAALIIVYVRLVGRVCNTVSNNIFSKSVFNVSSESHYYAYIH